MNEKFITRTNFNKSLCRDFVSYINLHRQIWLYVVVLVVIGILEYVNNRSAERVMMFVLVMIGMYFISSYISSLILTKRNGKFLKIRFYEHHMFAETEHKREKITYELLNRIVERDKCFYLFFTKNRGAFIIEKAGFEKGSVDKFYDFIKSHLPVKRK
ncbi:YcxB family protein [Pectinatus cerevisiiphilus]|uniref:YcxB-like protein n=1 Tax=Pectinatus cerevisiiphilus TaxID=86956 RepID=A0A4R3K6C9_9FIRM|nr:YcxB family protein [Pectinatus cerevisiiphilus]TCS78426.1 YcxB-like protein [Pectinatus cerevisiiphilus]